MFENCKNSKKQGDIGLGLAISYFCQNGYTVSIPLTDSQEYDLIVENGKLQRVQVKTTSHKNKEGNKYVVNLRVMGGNQKKYWCKKFDNSKVELLFIVTSNGSQYLIPTNEVNTVNSITLYKPYDKYLIFAGSVPVGGL